tara:strand:+ start:1843 stop:2463 length:621 start_codon:yes stop_codon:yes gene_type:complete
MGVQVEWRGEERTLPSGKVRTIRVAWLVDGDSDELRSSSRFLAYLGADPTITAQFKDEFHELYPQINIDWDSVEESLSSPSTDLGEISLSEFASKLRSILGEYGHMLDEVDHRLGHGRKRPLREIESFTRDSEATARFERTSGSIFNYLRQSHPESAYALYKAKLIASGEDSMLRELERHEPREHGSNFRQYRAYCVKFLEKASDF